ncbi:hypothetical protein ACPCHT_26080 [Nucisporomicrobium flavum]|jgi:hypothetical protein|uniref:hypothetical protein n=1 Tax=Nucisporomicrobium flavum TaxID=2785915 RepID=UPI0018F612E5|nr:hypothetical protein [Nucisporomicrobium flavum]
MTVQITVGEAACDGDSDNARGAVTVALARGSDAGRAAMIELVTASGHHRCAAKLTIAEAEVLQTALDSLIFDAAMRNGYVRELP